MWWYNILRGNEGSISHLLRIYPITEGSISLSAALVALKRGNPEPILIVKITEWMKLIDYFGLSIDTDLSKVGKLNAHFSILGLYHALGTPPTGA